MFNFPQNFTLPKRLIPEGIGLGVVLPYRRLYFKDQKSLINSILLLYRIFTLHYN